MIPFQAPVGTIEERASGIVWPGAWIDVSPFARRYRIGSSAEAFHTGADLNLNTPTWDADRHSAIYAVAVGDVVNVVTLPVWGNIIITYHPYHDDNGFRFLYCRYAHVENIQVRKGQALKMGDYIADVGNANGGQPFHLHFDVSDKSQLLRLSPGDWPKLRYQYLLDHYSDPRLTLQDLITPRDYTLRKVKVTVNKLFKRAEPKQTAAKVGVPNYFVAGEIVTVINAAPIQHGGYSWQRLADKTAWIAINYTTQV